MKKYELAPKMLRATCEIDKLTFKTTEDIPPFEGIIGQERAARAIEFGLKIKNNGYNILLRESRAQEEQHRLKPQ